MRRQALNERGFSLIAAIFLLVVLAGLGAAMANFSVMQHTSAAMDVQGARAYQAARAGLEWGLYRALIVTPCPAGPTSFTPAAPTLAGFTVTVTCITTISNANPNTTPPITVMQLTSTACNQPAGTDCPGVGGAEDYVQRVVQVTFGIDPRNPVIYRRELHYQ